MWDCDWTTGRPFQEGKKETHVYKQHGPDSDHKCGTCGEEKAHKNHATFTPPSFPQEDLMHRYHNDQRFRAFVGEIVHAEIERYRRIRK